MDLYFSLSNEIIRVRVNGKSISFYPNALVNTPIPIEILIRNGNTSGILKEFPELKGLPDSEVKEKAVERFKERLKKMNTENDVKDYVISELSSQGYVLKAIQRDGFRKVSVS